MVLLDLNLDEVYIEEANFVEGFEFNRMSKTLSKVTLLISPNFYVALKIIDLLHIIISEILIFQRTFRCKRKNPRLSF